MSLRKGQKLINYLRKKYYDSDSIEIQDSDIRRFIYNISDKEFDYITNMSDEDCWNKIYNRNGMALSDKILKKIFSEDEIKMMKDINKTYGDKNEIKT